jgi:hypothetical protein
MKSGHTYGHTSRYQTSKVRQEPPNNLSRSDIAKTKATHRMQRVALFGGGGVWESNPPSTG